ncbi:MAG: hypothetical protein AAGG75_15260 [Bacteroidota bacterium]
MKNENRKQQQPGSSNPTSNGHQKDASIASDKEIRKRPPRRRDYESVGVQMGLTGDAQKLKDAITEFQSDFTFVKTKLKEISDESVHTIDRLESKVQQLLTTVQDGVQQLKTERSTMVDDLKRFKSSLLIEELAPELQQKYYEDFLLDGIKRISRANDRMDEKVDEIYKKLQSLDLDEMKKQIQDYKEEFIFKKTEELNENMELIRKGFKYGDALNEQSGK